MDDDHLKLIALIIAVGDGRKHNITSIPALLDESFRSSFAAGGGATLALTNNADLVSAAGTSRVRFQNVSGRGSPFERMLDSTVAAPAAPSVGDTHATSSGSGNAGLTGDRGSASTSLDAGMRTPDHLRMSRDETVLSPATTSERSAMVAESGDTDAPVPAHTQMCASAMAAARWQRRRRLQ